MSAVLTPIVEYPQWRQAVTPRHLFDAPVHRWYVFPHSYAPQVVEDLVAEWGLGKKQTLLDPFVGAGTTLVAARELGLKVVGFDLSPLAVFVSDVKANPPNRADVMRAWTSVRRRSAPTPCGKVEDLAQRAFEPSALKALIGIRDAVNSSEAGSPQARRFLMLVLLGVLPRFSRLVRKGGWLSEAEPELKPRHVFDAFEERFRSMLEEVPRSDRRYSARVRLADARQLPMPASSVDGLVTSPPYVNRHDYTRVFGVELAFAFLDWERTRALRYQSIHSHPEAKPTRPRTDYKAPRRLTDAVAAIAADVSDPRISKMLGGYFEDIYCCLIEMKRVLRRGGHAALVVGNVQYAGTEVSVDTLVADLSERAGLKVEEIRAARYRGNSAQQMRQFGRAPARESVVLLRT